MSPTGACSGRAPRATQLQRTPTLHAFFPAVKQAFRQVPSGGGCRRPAGRLLRSHWHLPLPAALQQGDEGGASTSVGTVVDYDASAVNHVRIVGRLGRDVEVLAVGERALSLGRTRLAVKQPGGSGGTTGWFDVEVWGEAAEAAAAAVSKGDLVLVEGRLRQNNWVDEASGVKKSSTVVVAARIEKKVGPGAAAAGDEASHDTPGRLGAAATAGSSRSAQQAAATAAAAAAASSSGYSDGGSGGGGGGAELLWQSLLDDPSSFWDNRQDKASGRSSARGPDFKHKASRQGLWLSSAPGWAAVQLQARGLGPLVDE